MVRVYIYSLFAWLLVCCRRELYQINSRYCVRVWADEFESVCEWHLPMQYDRNGVERETDCGQKKEETEAKWNNSKTFFSFRFEAIREMGKRLASTFTYEDDAFVWQQTNMNWREEKRKKIVFRYGDQRTEMGFSSSFHSFDPFYFPSLAIRLYHSLCIAY